MDRRRFIAALTVTVASPLMPVLASESELPMLPSQEAAGFEDAERLLLDEVDSAAFVLFN